MLLTVGIERLLEIQGITRKYGHGYRNEQKREALAVIFSLVRSASVSLELHAR